jgi:putative transposase
MVILVEQHVIQDRDPRFEKIDAASFATKNRYNLGNTTIRRSWLFGGGYTPFAQRYHRLKGKKAYQALPHKVSQQVLV